MRKIDFKYLWLFLASTVPLLLVGCSGTGIARTPTENTTYLTPIPGTTLAALGNRTVISENNYGQKLTLHVGEIIQLNRIQDDHFPLSIDNPQILQILSNPMSSIVILKATAIGTAWVTSYTSPPCPAAPYGCQPPKPFEYFFADVVPETLITLTPPTTDQNSIVISLLVDHKPPNPISMKFSQKLYVIPPPGWGEFGWILTYDIVIFQLDLTNEPKWPVQGWWIWIPLKTGQSTITIKAVPLPCMNSKYPCAYPEYFARLNVEVDQ